MNNNVDRRNFLKGSAFLAVGAAAGWAAPFSVRALTAGGPSADARLKELGIELLPVTMPKNPFVPSVRVDNLLYTSGSGPRKAEGGYVYGKVGQDLTLEEGKAAARLTGISILSILQAELGSLDKVVRLVKVLGMVNCTTDFKQQPAVINGFSELMVEVFGETAGKGARSAVGMGSLPANIPVEIEAIFQVRD